MKRAPSLYQRNRHEQDPRAVKHPRSWDAGATSERLSVNDVFRFLLELVALFSLGLWGCTAFALPWPGLLVAAGSVAAAAILWGTFRSPKAPVRLRVFGRALVEIIVMGTAVFTWFAIGLPLVGGVLGVIVIVSGVYNLRVEVRVGRP
jgi:hypothetical protein